MIKEEIQEFIARQKTSIVSSVGKDGYPTTRALIQPVLIIVRRKTMQNDQINKAVSWNPWHGCKKVSPGCKNCFVYKMDRRYGRDTTIITKGKTTYELKDKDCPFGSVVKLCFSSDFFIEEADEWRAGCWDFIRRRRDCIFVTTTKRPERIRDCVPPDWGDGWEHVHISISIENQKMADKRLVAFLAAPVKHREVFCSPLIAPISLGCTWIPV